jgi:hypothetical protein
MGNGIGATLAPPPPSTRTGTGGACGRSRPLPPGSGGCGRTKPPTPRSPRAQSGAPVKCRILCGGRPPSPMRPGRGSASETGGMGHCSSRRRLCGEGPLRPGSSLGGIDGRVTYASGILLVQSSSVAGKSVMVEPPEPDRNNLPNRAPHGEDKPEHTYGTPQEAARCLRPVVENSSESMKVVDLDGALLSGPWRSR